MANLNNATTENLLTTPFMTEFEHFYFNPGTKIFPKEYLTVEVTNNNEFKKFNETCKIVHKNTPVKDNKEKTKQYAKFNISKDFKVFNADEKNFEIKKTDIEELFKTKDAKIIFTVHKYSMNGKEGLTFKAQQMQVRERPNKYANCLF